jgi:hypothetical protein
MQRIALGLALTVLAIAAVAEARPLATGPIQLCGGTTDGPEWTQIINETGHLPPPRTDRLRLLHGTRYYVFVLNVRCAWAKQNASRLVPLETIARVRAASPRGFLCSLGPTTWFKDAFNFDTVRRSQPPSSIGSCTTQKTEAVPGKAYHSFFWTPAKPCRLRPKLITQWCP